MPPAQGARKHILLSAFACSPVWGSEPGVGWRWALELARHHDVTVLTHSHFRAQIEPLAAAGHTEGIRFEWFSVPGVGGHPHRQLNSRLYYWLWQWTLRRRVKALLARQRCDAIHHLTWGTYRFPSFLGGLGVPLIVGPVGGGEGAPWRLWRHWPWREQLFYALRQGSILASRWDPFVVESMRRADCVLTKTQQTRDALPASARTKAFDASEIGVADVADPSHRPHDEGAPLQLLYAGRLIGGKGVPYLLPMMRRLLDRGVAVHLTLAGDGRLAPWLRQRIATLGLQSHVRLLGKVDRPRMPALYDANDLLVFPSWQDSSGNVVTAALARGVPVLCLDLGGPCLAVDADCACVVSTAGLDDHGVAAALADEVVRLARQRGLLRAMSTAALRRARQLTWAAQVDRSYRIVARQLGWAPLDAHQPETPVHAL